MDDGLFNYLGYCHGEHSEKARALDLAEDRPAKAPSEKTGTL